MEFDSQVINCRCLHGSMCIEKHWRNDGNFDCLDGSDESDVLDTNSVCNSATHAMASLQHKAALTMLSPPVFQCSDRQTCIPRKFLCDGYADCVTRSDEANCTYSTIRSPSTPRISCPPKVSVKLHIFGYSPLLLLQNFACRSGTECINRQFVCDGAVDCSDS